VALFERNCEAGAWESYCLAMPLGLQQSQNLLGEAAVPGAVAIGARFR